MQSHRPGPTPRLPGPEWDRVGAAPPASVPCCELQQPAVHSHCLILALVFTGEGCHLGQDPYHGPTGASWALLQCSETCAAPASGRQAALVAPVVTAFRCGLYGLQGRCLWDSTAFWSRISHSLALLTFGAGSCFGAGWDCPHGTQQHLWPAVLLPTCDDKSAFRHFQKSPRVEITSGQEPPFL